MTRLARELLWCAIVLAVILAVMWVDVPPRPTVAEVCRQMGSACRVTP